MDHPNLKKLAKELNLAISTVSRALRDSHEISQQTKDRVKAYAEKIGFQPNPHASSLRQNKSRTIAVVIPEIENNFFSGVINGVELIAQQKGYHVLIYLTHEDFTKERSILNVLRNGRVDGIMISVSNTTSSFEHVESYLEAGIPVVSFDRVCGDIDVPRVTTDDTAISMQATEHLLKKGCSNIAFLAMSAALSISSSRQHGYLKALRKYGLENKALLVECTTDDAQNRDIIRKMIQKEKPDGIFATVEKLAINTYEVCQSLEIQIPREIKVISFSNLSASAFFNPPLSTIVQPAYTMGCEAAAILFKQVEKKRLLPNERKIVVPSKLIERASTGK
jgi:LacI family transcriptional regulator